MLEKKKFITSIFLFRIFSVKDIVVQQKKRTFAAEILNIKI